MGSVTFGLPTLESSCQTRTAGAPTRSRDTLRRLRTVLDSRSQKLLVLVETRNAPGDV